MVRMVGIGYGIDDFDFYQCPICRDVKIVLKASSNPFCGKCEMTIDGLRV